jgi:uncharacterized protein (DUF952 family)
LYAPASLAAEGFVHLSFADQVEAVANARYRDVPELVAVEFDPATLGVEVRVEDSYGEGTAFPHAYGPLPADAVVAVHALERTPGGAWRFNPGRAADRASPDR